jgi:hypothetical protein
VLWLGCTKDGDTAFSVKPFKFTPSTMLLGSSTLAVVKSTSRVGCAPCWCVIALAATVQFLQAGDLQQLQQLVQQAVQNNNTSSSSRNSSSSLTATDAAAAYAAVTRLSSGNQPAAAAAAATAVLQLLAPAWQSALPAATIQDVANVLLCWSKLRYNNAQLWGSSLAAVPALCSAADGQDLANVALALATAAEAAGGAVPGVTREEAEEVLRWVELASCPLQLVQSA